MSKNPVRFTKVTRRGLARIVDWLRDEIELHGGINHALFRTHDAKEKAQIFQALTWLDQKAGPLPSSVSSVKRYGVAPSKRSDLHDLVPKKGHEDDGA